MTEQWKAVPGYEGWYEVSDHGRVRSLDRWVHQTNQSGPYRRRLKGQMLRPCPKSYYPNVLIRGAGKKPRSMRLHVLVLLAFVGPRPEWAVEIRHLDGDPRNNHLENLKYGTQSENALDRVLHGTHMQASKTECKYGHEFTPENTYIIPSSGSRQCRQCSRRLTREHKARLRASKRASEAVA